MTTAPARQPAVFIGHGAPTNALEDNKWTREWQAIGQSLPEKPRAILAVSAHWYINATAVTAMSAPRTAAVCMARASLGMPCKVTGR